MKISFFRPRTAMAVVIANMVGTGVFTSLGFQLLEIQSGFVLMMLWLVGGITALCGALTYAELGASLPRSGGEYNFLSQIYHPVAGFVSGWISITVGFAAPSALAAITFGNYLASAAPELLAQGINARVAACVLVIFLTPVHCFSRASSSGIQSFFTLIKIILILLFCFGALLWVEQPVAINFLPTEGDGKLLLGGAFAVSLIFVNYAYTGWNAATYLTDELENPRRHLPVILITGTFIVLLLYLLLNYTFLSVAPVGAMEGKIEIAYIAASYAFGESGAKLIGLVLAVLLISTVSAMLMAGPRVLQVIGQDYRIFKFLSHTNSNGVPYKAIVFQSLLTLLFIATSSFESILVFSGFILALNTLFTVFGVFVLRWKYPHKRRSYSTFWYPVPPLIYLGITLWTLIYIIARRPEEGYMGMAMIGMGLVLYWATHNRKIGDHRS